MGKNLVHADDYAMAMKEQVLPYLQERRQDEILKATDQASLFTSFFTADEPRGTVMLLHGYTENIEKFSEVIYGFLKEGYSVCTYDQRGHGRSYRDPELKYHYLTHVDRFEDYLTDAEMVYDRWMKDAPSPKILFAHSMGGGVAALILERGLVSFDKAVLNSPMIAPATGNFPAWTGKAICRGAKLLGKSKEMIFLAGPYTGEEKFEDSCASGKERFDWYNEVRKTHPEFQNCSPSYSWTLESLKVCGKILAKGKPEKIRIPVMIFQASDDHTVLAEPQAAFASRLPQGQIVRIENARHEIYRSGNEAADEWWDKMMEFIEN